MQLALEFYGPMFLLYSVYDGAAHTVTGHDNPKADGTGDTGFIGGVMCDCYKALLRDTALAELNELSPSARSTSTSWPSASCSSTRRGSRCRIRGWPNARLRWRRFWRA